MELSLDFLKTVAHYKILIYCAIFLMVLVIEKKVTSMTITMIIILLHEYFSDAIFDELYSIASNPEILSKYYWYATWVAAEFIAMYLIYYLHLKLKLRVSRVAYFYSALLLAFSIAQVIDFIDRATFKSDAFATTYQMVIFVGNVVAPFYILSVWLRELHLDRITKYKS